MVRKNIDTMNKLAMAGKLDLAMTKRPAGQRASEIDLDKIAPDPDQPRKNFDMAKLTELSTNISQHGVLQAIVVQPPNADGIHMIIMGERRYRAAKQAGLKSLPATVKKATAELRAIQLSENIQRQELSTMEIARAVDQMKTDGRSRKDIAKALGWSEPQISHFSGVLTMDPRLQELAEQSVQVRALIILQKLWNTDQNAVEKFLDNISPEEITRAAAEELKIQIDQQSETGGQLASVEAPPPTILAPRKVSKSAAESSSKGQIVFFCEQGGAIGRLITNNPASSSHAVLVSFENGDRIEKILLEDIKLHEAVKV